MTRARGGRPRKCLWNNRILIEWEQEPRTGKKQKNKLKICREFIQHWPWRTKQGLSGRNLEMRQLQPVVAKLLFRIS